jgi:hypothetical protein
LKLYCGGHLTRFSALPVLTSALVARATPKTTPYAFAAATFQTGCEEEGGHVRSWQRGRRQSPARPHSKANGSRARDPSIACRAWKPQRIWPKVRDESFPGERTSRWIDLFLRQSNNDQECANDRHGILDERRRAILTKGSGKTPTDVRAGQSANHCADHPSDCAACQ